jgi:hypothetical protein
MATPGKRIFIMKPTSLAKAAFLMLLVLAVGVPTASAQILARREPTIEVPHVTVPPLVRFTGTLVPPDGGSANSLHTLRVFIQNSEWLFRLDNVETLTGTDYGWMILSDIFPPELHFTGPENLMRTLQAAEHAGNPVIVEGRLYISDRMFAVTDAGEAAEKAQ